MRFDQGVLCVVDGAKGLSKAVREVFGAHALIQRCQWHKRENGVSYLPKAQQESYRRQLQRAYQQPDYAQAKTALLHLHADLERVNRSAARSLLEGLEQTLTLHRLGLFQQLGRSLKTTNCIENLNAQLVKYLGRVKHWLDSDQRQRWVALGLLEIEQRMYRIAHAESLGQLRQAGAASWSIYTREEVPCSELSSTRLASIPVLYLALQSATTNANQGLKSENAENEQKTKASAYAWLKRG